MQPHHYFEGWSDMLVSAGIVTHLDSAQHHVCMDGWVDGDSPECKPSLFHCVACSLVRNAARHPAGAGFTDDVADVVLDDDTVSVMDSTMDH